MAGRQNPGIVTTCNKPALSFLSDFSHLPLTLLAEQIGYLKGVIGTDHSQPLGFNPMPFQHRIEHASRREIHAAACQQVEALENKIKEQQALIANQSHLLRVRNHCILALTDTLEQEQEQGLTLKAVQVTLRQARDEAAALVLDTMEAFTMAARWGLPAVRKMATVSFR
jgi:hypothetical protein